MVEWLCVNLQQSCRQVTLRCLITLFVCSAMAGSTLGDDNLISPRGTDDVSATHSASSVGATTNKLLPPPKRLAGTTDKSAGSGRQLLPAWDTKRVGIVLAMFGGLMVVQRLLTPRAAATLPAGAIQVCGKVPLDAKQSVHLVKIGERLLVLLESPQGMQRLAEITDPQEIRSLLDPTQVATRPTAKTDRESRFYDHGALPEVHQMLAQFQSPRTR